eukprot:TRINITY_DN8274_c0_g2_i1.p5 TRINITY_DN8274_c0_g2~~TRINITY_DN8274_c0_g2_i1.p5  ORF type:complete len:136 (-),score=43.11 TRINITY_DN8274_c0_g2_i1:127-534(-)
MWGGDGDGGHPGEAEGGVEGSHGRDEVGDEVLVGGGDDFVADGDLGDLGGGEEGGDVGGDPGLGGGELGQGGDVAVGDGDGDGDVGVGEGGEDGGVGVEELDVGDGGVGFQEARDLGRGREVVCKSAVVDAYGEI